MAADDSDKSTSSGLAIPVTFMLAEQPPMRVTLLISVFLWFAVCQFSAAETTAPDKKVVPTSGIFTRRYRCPDDYPGMLYRRAFEKTGDVSFQPPEGKNVTWDPKPSIALKKLGLQIRENYSMSFVYSEKVFVYSADVKGHEEFLKLNQLLNLKVRRVP